MAIINWINQNVIEKEKLESKIEQLKKQLSDTDYKIVKSSEYQLLEIEIPYDLQVLHLERENTRVQINELEDLIKKEGD